MTPDAAHHFFVLAVLALATIFAIFAMRTFAAARQGRRGSAQGADVLAAMQRDLGEVKSRIASVETMLREVG